MQNSQLNSLTVPTVGSMNPATLFKAGDIPMRVVITNIGGNVILLAHDTSTLSTKPPVFANTYGLAVGAQVVIVLAPEQGVFAVAIGINGQASVAVSEALPVSGS
jgi:hypothetical protein